ncbi:MAG: PEP-CTERM sorting domain-containing protein, partial [Armatimonadetes bacterium]|nr:PEP-CTERM sorting domain-containing protein [Armatimonadota bacterium]
LYIHAGMPEAVSDAAPLALAAKSLPALPNNRPRFVSLLLKSGASDTIGDRLAMQKNARAVSAAQYAGVPAAVSGTVEGIVRGETLPLLAGTMTDDSRMRLLQYRDALAVWYEHNNFGTEALAAAKIVAGARLVTPLSGAVVLETQEDYKRNGLDDGSGDAEKQKEKAKNDKKDDKNFAKDATKLVTPEPGTWLLIVVGGAGMLGFAWRKRR